MTTKLEQAARQALEALVRLTNWMNDRRMIVAGAEFEAITALREALEQPVIPDENPQDWRNVDGCVAWHLIDRHADNWGEVGEMMDAWLKANSQAEQPVSQEPALLWGDDKFAPSEQSVSQEPVELRKWTLLLTGENHGLVGYFGSTFEHNPDFYERVDVYTAPQPVSQEPIGMIMGGELVGLVNEYKTGAWPIYTAPQPVKEVELTDDEIVELPNFDGVPIGKRQRIGFARAVIAAHKEKQK